MQHSLLHTMRLLDLSPLTVHISLFAEADLRIGKLEWGDSGVYFCKVVIANDLEGKNEAHLELLVLGMLTLHLYQSKDIKALSKQTL